jgi:hypothetical protein
LAEAGIRPASIRSARRPAAGGRRARVRSANLWIARLLNLISDLLTLCGWARLGAGRSGSRPAAVPAARGGGAHRPLARSRRTARLRRPPRGAGQLLHRRSRRRARRLREAALGAQGRGAPALARRARAAPGRARGGGLLDGVRERRGAPGEPPGRGVRRRQQRRHAAVRRPGGVGGLAARRHAEFSSMLQPLGVQPGLGWPCRRARPGSCSSTTA